MRGGGRCIFLAVSMRHVAWARCIQKLFTQGNPAYIQTLKVWEWECTGAMRNLPCPPVLGTILCNGGNAWLTMRPSVPSMLLESLASCSLSTSPSLTNGALHKRPAPHKPATNHPANPQSCASSPPKPSLTDSNILHHPRRSPFPLTGHFQTNRHHGALIATRKHVSSLESSTVAA